MRRLGYVKGNSFLHRIDPRVKLVSLVCGLVLIFLYHEPLYLFLFISLLLVLFAFSGVGFGSILRRARFLFVFGILIFASYAFFVHSGAIWLNVLLGEVGGHSLVIRITSGGFMGGLAISLRFLSIVLSSMLFVAVTDPAVLAHGLMRSGLPYRYGFTFIMALRFLPLFEMETSIVQNAQRARGLEIDNPSLKSVWLKAKYTFTPMLATGLSRVDNLSRSMDARGFGLHNERTYLRNVEMGRGDKALLVFVIGASVMAVAFRLGLVSLHFLSFLPDL
ncbi:MAG: energy-coupling factor transporter transmembrane component T [Candidatus Thermoplasmatota archaeon]|nr:energy-coupling factor transporter transmembrane component T [Candidatus Thermoplasmatota archaeon]